MGCSPSRPHLKSKAEKGCKGQTNIAYFNIRGKPDGEEKVATTDHKDRFAIQYHPCSDMPTDTTSIGSSSADLHENIKKDDLSVYQKTAI